MGLAERSAGAAPRQAPGSQLYEEAPQDEREAIRTEVADLATAAQTVEELAHEIAVLADLEAAARRVRLSGRGAKWTELQRILDEDSATRAPETSQRRTLVLFTEFKDTLTHLANASGPCWVARRPSSRSTAGSPGSSSETS